MKESLEVKRFSSGEVWAEGIESYTKLSVFNSVPWVESLVAEALYPIYLEFSGEDKVFAKKAYPQGRISF